MNYTHVVKTIFLSCQFKEIQVYISIQAQQMSYTEKEGREGGRRGGRRELSERGREVKPDPGFHFDSHVHK